MARLASTVLVVALLAATATAFALTEGLKLEPSPILGTRVDKVFSPVCRCESARARISFRLREADRLDIALVDSDETSSPHRSRDSGSSAAVSTSAGMGSAPTGKPCPRASTARVCICVKGDGRSCFRTRSRST